MNRRDPGVATRRLHAFPASTWLRRARSLRGLTRNNDALSTDEAECLLAPMGVQRRRKPTGGRIAIVGLSVGSDVSRAEDGIPRTAQRGPHCRRPCLHLGSSQARQVEGSRPRVLCERSAWWAVLGFVPGIVPAPHPASTIKTKRQRYAGIPAHGMPAEATDGMDDRNGFPISTTVIRDENHPKILESLFTGVGRDPV